VKQSVTMSATFFFFLLLPPFPLIITSLLNLTGVSLALASLRVYLFFTFDLCRWEPEHKSKGMHSM
jgi:hypothetical protein